MRKLVLLFLLMLFITTIGNAQYSTVDIPSHTPKKVNKAVVEKLEIDFDNEEIKIKSSAGWIENGKFKKDKDSVIVCKNAVDSTCFSDFLSNTKRNGLLQTSEAYIAGKFAQ